MRKASRDSVGLGVRLRDERERRGLSQKQLALRAGCAPSSVSMIESGERPNPGRATIEALEKALGDPPFRLLYEDPPEDASLATFLDHPLGRSLEIGDIERAELASFRWWLAHESPTPQQWYDFVRLRRSIRSR